MHIKAICSETQQARTTHVTNHPMMMPASLPVRFCDELVAPSNAHAALLLADTTCHDVRDIRTKDEKEGTLISQTLPFTNIVGTVDGHAVDGAAFGARQCQRDRPVIHVSCFDVSLQHHFFFRSLNKNNVCLCEWHHTARLVHPCMPRRGLGATDLCPA